MLFAITILTAVLTSRPAPVPVAPAQGCLHEAGKETPKERDRSVAALGATRAINTAESTYAAKNNKAYAHREELAGYLDGARYNLAGNAEIVPGFKLTLDTSEKGYWFMIKDQTDPCGFTYISNQDGLIFAAQPIR